jgi:fructuronate reductase
MKYSIEREAVADGDSRLWAIKRRAVYGCLLGYTLIREEMKDEDLVKLIRRLGYQEGLPVVTDPVILSPRSFIDEVVEERLPNPFMPDAPQRIATDTSQKVGIRFGETIKSYIAEKRPMDQLVALPLAIAGWLRYLKGVTDSLEPFELSPDPMNEELQEQLASIDVCDPSSLKDQLRPILSNARIFGSDLYQAGIGELIEEMFRSMLEGKGAVRRTLVRYLGE